jgi:hypothetical protein
MILQGGIYARAHAKEVDGKIVYPDAKTMEKFYRELYQPSIKLTSSAASIGVMRDAAMGLGAVALSEVIIAGAIVAGLAVLAIITVKAVDADIFELSKDNKDAKINKPSMPDSQGTPDPDWDPDDDSKSSWRKWEIKNYDKAVEHSKHGKIYRDPETGLWWSKDTAKHGGSAWKVYKWSKDGLKWYKDADQYGNYIVGKHKSEVGKFIPWNEIRGIHVKK